MEFGGNYDGHADVDMIKQKRERFLKGSAGRAEDLPYWLAETPPTSS